MLPSMLTNHPDLKVAKHPHTITLPPPCFPVVITCFQLNAVFALWHKKDSLSDTGTMSEGPRLAVSDSPEI